jgi:hypothetical protein
MNRRNFMQCSTLAAMGGVLSGGAGPARRERRQSKGWRVSSLKRPVAIAMWDFSWLLRHHPCGEFEDWDRVLDGLVERGYDAIRLDVFPNLVAAQPDGQVRESFHFPKHDWKPAMWGNSYSMDAEPRKALLEFIPKCEERGIHLGLSTWFFGPGAGEVHGFDEFTRVWTETLAFMEEADLLNNVLYVDLLNEYPMFHGFTWLADELKRIENEQPADHDARQAHEWGPEPLTYSAAQLAFYRQFMTDAIARIRARWPQFDYMACQTFSGGVPWQQMDFTEYDVLDVHYWFCLNGLLPTGTGYWEQVHSLADDTRGFPDVNRKLLENWHAHKEEMTAWMDEMVGGVAAKARELGVPCGNTEGWGTINWIDHPAFTWDIIKEAGLIGADLGARHGYAFNCSSNFTHPQFPRLWNDIAWHREVTGRIRAGKIA